MNPDDIPVKFKLHTRVKIVKGNNVGHTGSIIEERRDGKNNHVSFDGGGHAWFSDHELEALPVPEVGDLVRVRKSGRWQAQEGHITRKEDNHFFVDLEYDWELPLFQPEYLEVIEKVKPKPRRMEGTPIQPEAVKRGDVISVVTVEEGDIKKTTIVEATVGRIIEKNFLVRKFLTAKDELIFETNVRGYTINLVKAIDSDTEYQQLSEAKLGEVIGFPDEEGGAETNVAVRQANDFWSVMLGTQKGRVMDTAGVVTMLRKKNVTFSVIRKAPEEFEFPKGTNVRVSPQYSTSLSSGNYRVVIEGEKSSVIKSRGISASTHTIPNRWLFKG